MNEAAVSGRRWWVVALATAWLVCGFAILLRGPIVIPDWIVFLVPVLVAGRFISRNQLRCLALAVGALLLARMAQLERASKGRAILVGHVATAALIWLAVIGFERWGRIREHERRSQRALAFLRAVNAALLNAEAESALLEEVCTAAVSAAGYRFVWIGYAENDAAKTVRPVARAGVEDGYLDGAGITWGEEPRGRGPTGRAIRSGEPAMSQDIAHDAGHAPWREAAARRGLASALAVPLADRDGVFGAVMFYTGEPHAFDASEIELLRETAHLLSYGIGVRRAEVKRRQVEQALRVKSEELDLHFEHALDLLSIADTQGYFLRVNRAWAQCLDCSLDDLNGKRYLDLIHPEDVDKTVAAIRQIGSRGARTLVNRYRRRDGSYRWIEWHSYQTGDRIYGVARDITERKETEDTLLRLRQAVDCSGEAIFMTDSEGRMTFVNREFTRLYGLGEADVLGGPVPAGVAGYAEGESAAPAMPGAGGEVVRDEIVAQAREGRQTPVERSISSIVDDAGHVVGHLFIHRDVAARHLLEEQFRQAQKMDAVGRLAGGIAHDFNNLLTVINGYAELLMDQPSMSSQQRHQLAQIRRAGERAGTLTGQLLSFSRRQDLNPTVLDLNPLLERVGEMLRRLIGEDIELRLQLMPGVGAVRADAAQLEQVVINLAINARDAMPQGGKLTIASGQGSAAQQRGAGAHGEVWFSVTDTGTGMSRETMERIFEPFFTTKDVGKGTGLGLASVYGSIQQSGGRITVDSTMGRGSTFTVYLPQVETPAARSRKPQMPEGGPGAGGETLLVVEDEPAVLELILSMLSETGCQLLSATSGEDALKVAGSWRGPIDVLLTDVIMPGMSGKELADRLAATRPEVKVIYMSGYTAGTLADRGVSGPSVNFLHKPVSTSALLDKIAEVLGRNDRTTAGGA